MRSLVVVCARVLSFVVPAVAVANVYRPQDILASLLVATVAVAMTMGLARWVGPSVVRRGPLRLRGTAGPQSDHPAAEGPPRRTVLLGAVAAVGASSACSATSTTSPTVTPPDAASPSANPGPTSAAPQPVPVVLTRPGPDLTAGPLSSNAVALTFHGAGDPKLTSAALTIAASAGARLTVFAVGEWLAAHPGLGRDIVAAGHDLGNHTWSHQEMPSLSLPQATEEIQRGAEAVKGAVGQAGLLFRPSGTQTSTPTIRAAAQAAGYQRCVSYDVDPLDYTDPGAQLVTSRTLAGVRPGSIVSLHLGHPGTIEALGTILSGLAARGLAAVTVTALLHEAS